MADNTGAAVGKVTESAKSLPKWVWIAVIGGGLVIGLILRSRNKNNAVAAATGNTPPGSATTGDGTALPGTDPYASADNAQLNGQVYGVDPSTGTYSNLGPSGTSSTVFIPPALSNVTGGGAPDTSTFAHASDIKALRQSIAKLTKQNKTLMKRDDNIRKHEKALAKARHNSNSGLDASDNPNIPDAAQ